MLTNELRRQEITENDFNILQRDNIDSITTAEHFSPQALIGELKTADQLLKAYNSDGAAETRLDTHTLRVMTLAERYNQDLSFPEGITKSDYRLFLALHDIGKPRSLKEKAPEKEHQYTLNTISSLYRYLHYSQEQIHFAESLLEYDPIGEYIQGKIDIATARQQIERGAKKVGMIPDKFFKLLVSFFQVDAGSYTLQAGGEARLDFLFTFDHEQNRIHFAPDIQQKVNPLFASFT